MSDAEPDIVADVAYAILRLRELRGWKQAELGKLCGLRQGYISEIEHRKREPSLTVLSRIAVALEVPVSVLVTRPRLPLGESDRSDTEKERV